MVRNRYRETFRVELRKIPDTKEVLTAEKKLHRTAGDESPTCFSNDLRSLFLSLSSRRSFLLSYASFSSFSLFLPPRLVFDTRQYCDHSFSTLSLLLLLLLVLVNSIGNERSRRVWIVEIDRVLRSPSTKRRPFDLFTFLKSWLTESKQLPSRILVFLVCQT